MANFLSLKTLAGDSLFAARRFTLCLLSAIVGSGASIYASYLDYVHHQDEQNIIYLIMVCSLGLTLFLSISLFAERKNFTRNKTIIYNVIGLASLVTYYFLLRNYANTMEFVRYALINIALHLFASFAAFTGKHNLKGFWQFNKALFLRLFFAVIYSGTLYLGICLALMGIDKLFGVRIDGKNYFRLWIIIAGIFNTWFFLAGIPKNLEELDQSEDYPKGLKIFTQYVLLPLVTLYLLILYSYMFKIIFTQNLPKGWVSYLVIGFSIAGVLALLLIHPIRNKEGNTWIRIFSKWFYGALYPLVIMLFVAIGRRMGDYGITENRYFIIVLAIWLAGISTYFLFSKVSNIKYVPLTLCIIALLTSFGPWGAFSVSENSQMNILTSVLTKSEILKDGKIDAKHKTVSDSVARKITSIVKYFDNMHGFENFKPWFTQNIDTLISDTLRYERIANVMKLLNVKESYSYYRNDEDGDGYEYFNFYSNNEEVKNISGYDYEFNFNAYHNNNNYEKANIVGRDSIVLTFSKDTTALEIKKNSKLIYSLSFNEFLKQVNDSSKNTTQYGNSNTVSPEVMQKFYEDTLMKLKLQFNGIYGNRKKQKYKTESASGSCYIKMK